ncbi:hypothetical protein [Magnetospirillum molischianum]|uniref:Uncharacterized protein n=1 Tax=Magnetospirillum molischianum DSM 120 TaxID=1150626 RepID=H8FUX5_MAGML|nr:hypothetical protein [Magnetospirillum molischianum]CCG42163.1 hypothetical protein PHAMO_340036 [Magnetospirillum molischianum DSM 120]
MTEDIDALLAEAPGWGDPARAEWCRRLDEAMAASARRVAVASGVARAAAIEAKDHRAVTRAEQIAADALRLADLAEG